MTYRGLVPLACLDLGTCDVIARVLRYDPPKGRGPGYVWVEDATCTGRPGSGWSWGAPTMLKVWRGFPVEGTAYKLRLEVEMYRGQLQATVRNARLLGPDDGPVLLDPWVREMPVNLISERVYEAGGCWHYLLRLTYPGPKEILLTAGAYDSERAARDALSKAQGRMTGPTPETPVDQLFGEEGAVSSKPQTQRRKAAS